MTMLVGISTAKWKINLNFQFQRVHLDGFKNYLEYCQLKRVVKTDVLDRKRWSCTFNQVQFEENVANLVLKFMLPFHIVDNPVFRKIFDGRYRF